MRKTVAKRIHKYIIDQGMPPDDARARATRALKSLWNRTPRNLRYKLSQALA